MNKRLVDIFRECEEITHTDNFEHDHKDGDDDDNGYLKLIALNKLEEKLEEIHVDQKRQKDHKFYVLAILIVIVFSSIFWGILPAINYVFYSTKSSSILRNALANDTIPSHASIQDAITDDLLITAWDLNNRSPRMFTKLS